MKYIYIYITDVSQINYYINYYITDKLQIYLRHMLCYGFPALENIEPLVEIMAVNQQIVRKKSVKWKEY